MIGILDWGIGGLGVYAILGERAPGIPVVYLSDAGAIPYGKLPAARLAARVSAMAARLRAEGATHLVVACNAASTVLPALGVAGVAGTIETPWGALAVTGVIEHGIALARGAGARTLGVIGGRRTIRSGIYRRRLAQSGRRVRQRVAQPLSARIEAGELAGPALDADLARILAPLRDVDALLLACTHYPAIAPRIAHFVPDVRLLDPAAAVVDWVLAHWRPRRARGIADRFLTTGSPAAMRRAAAAAFGVSIPNAAPVVIAEP